jgi:3D (Asp-Asp-Asp) domain-containing protein
MRGVTAAPSRTPQGDAMENNWGNAIVVQPGELKRLTRDNRRLDTSRRWLRRTLFFVIGGCVVSAGSLYASARHLGTLAQELRTAREHLASTSAALTALARSHEAIIEATTHAPAVGTRSWGRRFTVTKYLPRSPDYGMYNDGFTATMTKADPKARIVAVDPKLIPYGSWVWVEGLGWFRAEDCGSAIKGFRLDVLEATERAAMAFGRQDRFAIVVPPMEAESRS